MGPTLLLVFVATAQLHPKLDPPAREALASAGPSEPVTLSAWLRDDALGFDARAALDARLGRRAGAAEVEAAIADVTREFAARMTAGVTGPFAAAARAAGFEVVVQGQLMPVVAFRGPRAALAGWLEARAEAASVHLDRPGAEELAASVPTLRADRVRAEPGGPTGAGVRVGIVDTGTVSTENPWLPPGTVTEGAGAPDARHRGGRDRGEPPPDDGRGRAGRIVAQRHLRRHGGDDDRGGRVGLWPGRARREHQPPGAGRHDRGR
jgi:hypothetical protein